MPRFFAAPEGIDGDRITITGPDVNHIRNVLRMAPDDNITVSDGSGMDYYCRITEMSKEHVLLTVIDSWRAFAELPADIWLFQGVPKGDKMDLIIQKAVELGAGRIVPVMMERTIVRLDDKKKEKRQQRWQSIAESAAKQAGRARIPVVTEVVDFDKAIKMCAGMDAILMPYEKAEGVEAARARVRSLRGSKTIGVFIGPEGGFAPEEVDKAVLNGAFTMTLGHRILRTETAGMTMLSIIMFELEEDSNDGNISGQRSDDARL